MNQAYSDVVWRAEWEIEKKYTERWYHINQHTAFNRAPSSTLHPTPEQFRAAWFAWRMTTSQPDHESMEGKNLAFAKHVIQAEANMRQDVGPPDDTAL